MIQVKIKNVASLQYTHGAKFDTSEEAQAWIDGQLSKGLQCAWGKPEHTIQVEISPYIPAEYDEEGNEVSPAVEAVYEDRVVPSEFSVEIVDISAEVEQEAANTEALAYLAATDWLVVRQAETGVAVPADITLARAEARARIIR